MQRSPLLRPRFRQAQRTRIKLKRRQRPPSIRNDRLGLPMQSPRNHQMKHQPHLIIKTQRNPLPNTPQLSNLAALHRINRRRRRAQQKRSLHHGANQVVARYVSLAGADSAFAQVAAGGTVKILLTDRLGSVRNIVSDSGVVLDQINRLRDDVLAKEEELKQAKRQLQKLEEAKKVLEAT